MHASIIKFTPPKDPHRPLHFIVTQEHQAVSPNEPPVPPFSSLTALDSFLFMKGLGEDLSTKRG